LNGLPALTYASVRDDSDIPNVSCKRVSFGAGSGRPYSTVRQLGKILDVLTKALEP
jgi:hypothetical protein